MFFFYKFVKISYSFFSTKTQAVNILCMKWPSVHVMIFNIFKYMSRNGTLSVNCSAKVSSHYEMEQSVWWWMSAKWLTISSLFHFLSFIMSRYSDLLDSLDLLKSWYNMKYWRNWWHILFNFDNLFKKFIIFFQTQSKMFFQILSKIS